MPRDYFQFKKFSIYQNRCAMKVGTDGVLLGAWTDTGTSERILDVGTGTGLIALMLAQRCKANIVAIELDEAAAHQARENVERSDWNKQIDVWHISFQDYATASAGLFDHIVCNPPFFKNSKESQLKNRSMARHHSGLSTEELITKASVLLTDKGKLSLIFPASDYESNVDIARNAGLRLVRKTRVIPHTGKSANRVLTEFEKGFKGQFSSDSLILYSDKKQSRTDEYAYLTREYYLNG